MSYSAAHRKIRDLKGVARDYECQKCGRPAASWSYDHRDPRAVVSPRGPYSMNPEHYQPLCAPCHTDRDLHREFPMDEATWRRLLVGIKHARTAAGMSKADLSRQTGVGVSLLCEMEKGRLPRTLKRMALVEEVYAATSVSA